MTKKQNFFTLIVDPINRYILKWENVVKKIFSYVLLVVVSLCLGAGGHAYKAWSADQHSKAGRFQKAFGMKAPKYMSRDWKSGINGQVYEKLDVLENRLRDALMEREDIIARYRSFRDSEDLAVALEGADSKIESAKEDLEHVNQSVQELELLSAD